METLYDFEILWESLEFSANKNSPSASSSSTWWGRTEASKRSKRHSPCQLQEIFKNESTHWSSDFRLQIALKCCGFSAEALRESALAPESRLGPKCSKSRDMGLWGQKGKTFETPRFGVKHLLKRCGPWQGLYFLRAWGQNDKWLSGLRCVRWFRTSERSWTFAEKLALIVQTITWGRDGKGCQSASGGPTFPFNQRLGWLRLISQSTTWETTHSCSFVIFRIVCCFCYIFDEFCGLSIYCRFELLHKP